MKTTKKKLIVIFLFFASNAVFAADTTATATVRWNAEAIKKADVELNVFASTDALAFKWNPSQKAFSSPSSSLTIQAAGKPGSSGYKITAAMSDKKLNHISGGSVGSLEVSGFLGGIQLAAVPVEILKGDDKKVTAAAAGLEGMNLAVAGPNLTPTGITYFEASNVNIKFDILKGMNGNVAVAAGKDLEKVPDGSYSGVVSISFVATWSK
ncbi:common pilus major fimbrillin subunit EcpA [Iodobacter sp. CM08]|uniref:common pilus major fimbrillin subunit EcpA n=1 Tax=Iodobacter sp. CM08 TaxID=3085902 RepID=UPI002982554B|nr:common pilus major fimbrillin subunit EcpA [Iodobacter sp. CM08]MDW5415921.1 common pilus major fimbrillin subunit EcpA [Iodobacter sp. CM08]